MISGGLYHETQVRLTYTFDRIEGSRGLRERNNERDFLIGTCFDGRNSPKTLLLYFEIETRS